MINKKGIVGGSFWTLGTVITCIIIIGGFFLLIFKIVPDMNKGDEIQRCNAPLTFEECRILTSAEDVFQNEEGYCCYLNEFTNESIICHDFARTKQYIRGCKLNP